MINIIETTLVLQQSETIPIIDVRTPAEFQQGHIPGAINIPLFSNEERTVVGTLYKQSGKATSVLKGLEFAGPKMAGFIKQANKITTGKKIQIHCWRGGMRSESMAWLFATAGFEVYLLKGGYKAYRNYIRQQLTSAGNFIILSGKTGSGKTEILLELRELGIQSIDLEGLANHKGSAFGSLGEAPQPSNEQFENNLYHEWSKLNHDKYILLEDESSRIGRVAIPEIFFNKMRSCHVIKIEMSVELRVKRLIKDYASFPKNQLTESVEKIRKRLGGQHANEIIAAIETDNFYLAIEKVLVYYDKTYNYGLNKRDQDKVHEIKTTTSDAKHNALLLASYLNKPTAF